MEVLYFGLPKIPKWFKNLISVLALKTGIRRNAKKVAISYVKSCMKMSKKALTGSFGYDNRVSISSTVF